MATEVKVGHATQADVAADMEHHRVTYGRFFNLLKWSLIGIAVILAVLFFAYF